MSKKNNVTDALKKVLAETYSLYLQTQNFHWNVTGGNFYQLHKYTEYAEAIDQIAEDIRTLGEEVPGTFTEFTELSSFELKKSAKNETEMLTILLKQTEQLIKSLTELEEVADEVDLITIEDLAVERLRAHKIHAWMLTSQSQK
jgi:starvation-inducible DNA-binding protein